MRQWLRMLAVAAAAIVAAAPGAAPCQELTLPGDFAGLRPSVAAEHFKLRAIASHAQVKPGQAFHVALVGELAKGWVFYSPDPGPVVLKGSLHVEAGPLRAGPALWPKDKAKTVDYGEGPVVNHAYEKSLAVYVPLTVPAEAAAGPVEVRLSPRGQICLEVCVNLEGPEELSAAVKIDVGAEAVANDAWTGPLADGLAAAMPAEQLAEAHRAASPAGAPRAAASSGATAAAAGYSVWAGLGLALLAGLTLNIMPCVLPIIPLRIYSLVQMAGQSRRRFVTLGLAFAGGIVLFFVGLAVVNVALKAAGSVTLDINEHFKYAPVRIGVAMVLLALAANLFGLFNVIVPSKIAGATVGEARRGHLPAVGMGLMMAVLSTPCSFWLMALALAWAQLQPLWLGTIAIVLIGVGMAAPHAVLAAFPGLVNKLPRPGRWMELFKQTMGFLLLPAVLYLLSTLGEGGGYPFQVAGFGVALAMALWVWGTWVRYDAPLARKLLVRGLAVAGTIAVGLWLLPRPAPAMLEFGKFDEARIASARADGRIVVVKVTAAWCTECKILDYQVFNTPEIAEQFRRRKVVAVKADVTDRDRPASRWVERTFGGAPPLTIIYPAGPGKPKVVPGRFSKADLLKLLDEAGGP